LRADDGWRIAGLADGTPFPGVEDGVEWGSYIARFSPDGVLQHVQRLGFSNTQVRGMQELDDGRFVVAGVMRGVDLDGNSAPTKGDALIRMFSADGETLWTRTYVTDADEAFETVAVLDDVVIAAGYQEPTAFVVGVDVATGEPLWSVRFGGGDTRPITSTVHGLGVVIGGSTGDDLATPLIGTYDAFLLRIGADGSLR